MFSGGTVASCESSIHAEEWASLDRNKHTRPACANLKLMPLLVYSLPLKPALLYAPKCFAAQATCSSANDAIK